MKQNKIYIYGKHALMEALANTPDVLSKVFLAPQVQDKELEHALEKAGVSVSPLGSGKEIESVAGSASHQGVVGRVTLDKLVRPYDDYIKTIKIDSDTAFALLDEVQDPHNVGAIIRSAVAFGVSAILLPEQNQSPVTGAVVKVSAGMVFRVPIISISDTDTAIRDLKNKGFQVYGLAGESTATISNEPFDKPTVFVFGNESKGLNPKTRALCDTLVSIPMAPKCESLNVAASAAVTLYAWSAKHPNLK